MMTRLIERFIIIPCIKNVRARQLLYMMFTSWIENNLELSQKRQAYTFLYMVLDVVEECVPMDSTISTLKLETDAILNNSSSSEPRMMCPKCKSLIKIPRMSGRNTIFWTRKYNAQKELVFQCYKCKYRKTLNISESVERTE